MAVDNMDSMVSVSYRDVPAAGCRVHRIWSAVDEADNIAMETQVISFTNPRALNVMAATVAVIPCGSISEILDAANKLSESFVITNYCERPIDISFMDASDINRCGFIFTRNWFVEDDCGMRTSFQQTIRVLDPQQPDRPNNGETNVELSQVLRWPQYPGAVSYKVFVWRYGSQQPDNATVEVTMRYYRPSEPYSPGTRFLWQVMYSINASTVIPSPIWGFETRSFADFVVQSLSIPPYAYSGTEFELSWNVINLGNISSTTPTWYDAVYLGRNADGSDKVRVTLLRETRYLDPQDGYISTTSIMLDEDDLGNFFVFVGTDVYHAVSPVQIIQAIVSSQM